ncbi:cysteine dioxygenase [Streptomyces albogriseolus]|uniref:cysteine dioxygenase n=1 Tax=Streptomyces albogriseolus TaxID=1887 RepID=UPI003CF8EB95
MSLRTITSAPVQATCPTQRSADFPGPAPAQLLEFVRRAAADADLVTALPLDIEGRTWARLQGPGGGEAWLIGRPPGTGTGRQLAEGIDRRRKLPPDASRTFGHHHVHEVLNESRTEHAVSVHAYRPPLSLTRRCSRTDSVLRLEQVERPEDWQ